MAMSSRFRFLLAAATTACVWLLEPPEGSAQQHCKHLDPPCVDNPPMVSISPSSGTFTNFSLSVSIVWADDLMLAGATRQIRLNGQDVRGNFSYTPLGGDVAESVGTVTLQAGSNTLTAEICDNLSQCTIESASYLYQAPPAPVNYAKPVVIVAPMSQDVRRTELCVADCYEAVLAHTTPAYVSLNTERAVTLVYRSGQGAKRRVLVEVDASDNSLVVPEKMSIKVRHPSGTWVQFLQGGDEVFYISGSGTSRLAAQFDATGLATGSHVYQVVVRTWWSGGNWEEATPVSFRVIVLNESGSPVGSGWTLAGLQRLHIQTDGILVTEGTGSAVFFPKNGSLWVAPAGEYSTLTYNSQTLRYTRTYADKSLAVFNGSGYLLFLEDRFGNRTSYTYSSNRLTTITDPIGKTISFAYNGSGKLTTITDAVGRQSTFTMNGSNVTQITDPDGIRAFAFTWDDSLRLSGYTDRRGGAWNVAYDSHGKLASVTAPTITVAGSAVSPVTTLSSWEKAVLPLSGGSSSSPAARVLPESARARVTDPNSKVTRLALNRFGAPVVIEGPLNDTTRLDWEESRGQLRHVRHPTGLLRTFTWTGGNITSTYDSGTGAVTSIIYDGQFNQPTLVSVGGVSIRNKLGSKGEVTSSRVIGVQDSTLYTYDARYRVLTVTAPGGLRTEHVYQATGFQNTDRVRLVKSGMTTRTTVFTYDAYGRVFTVTDPLSNVSKVEYDLVNRPTKTTDPRNFATILNYSANNVDLYRVTDAKSQVYTFNRNALGWVVSEVDPGGRTTTFAYDSAGNLRSTTNRRGQTVSLGYDAFNRVTSRTADGATTTWTYDNPRSRWMVVNNPVSRDTVFYNLAGRPTDQVTIRGTRRHHLRSTYRKEGPRDTLQMLAPWGRTVAYHYNNALQLDSLRDLSGQITRLTYNNAGLPGSIKLPTSGTPLQQTLSYTGANELSVSSFNHGAVQDVVGVTYIRDNLGNITSRRHPARDSVREFTYDKSGQLTRHTDLRSMWQWICDDLGRCDFQLIETQVGQVNYTYDAVGNRTDQSAVLQAGNRLVSFAGYTLGYDLDGNLVSKAKSGQPTQTFEWNSLNQLTKVTVGATVVTHAYDGFGRWAQRTGGGETLDFIYDNDDLFMEVVGSTLRREYAHYPGIDQPHSMRNWQGESGVTYYYGQDSPGHVLGLVNAANQVVNRYRYDPWGAAEVKSEAKANPLQYMGRYFDAHGGLYQVRARWYDPLAGRFISEDPIGLAGGINTYAYVSNDPLNWLDPMGSYRLKPIWVRGKPKARSPESPSPSPEPRRIPIATHEQRARGAGNRDAAAKDDPASTDESTFLECVQSETWANFTETNASIIGFVRGSWSGATSGTIGRGLAASGVRGTLGSSSVLPELYAYATSAVQTPVGRSRIFITIVRGSAFAGRAALVVTAAQEAGATLLAAGVFEGGVMLGSVGVGLVNCIGGL